MNSAISGYFGVHQERQGERDIDIHVFSTRMYIYIYISIYLYLHRCSYMYIFRQGVGLEWKHNGSCWIISGLRFLGFAGADGVAGA